MSTASPSTVFTLEPREHIVSWQDQDNRQNRGPSDRIYVSPTESWELHHYVDHYLGSRSYDKSDKNRQIVRDAIAKFPGRSPIKRDELTSFLDQRFKK